MPNFNQLYLLLFVLTCPFAGYGQSFEQELKEVVKTKPKFEYRMDSRHSFINQRGVKTLGFKLGIQFKEKLSFGLGYNQLWSPLERDIVVNGLETNVTLAFYNITPYVEYVFFKDDKWELSIPVQIGFGSSYYRNNELIGSDQLNKEFVFSYEPAITFQYRVFKYFGAGLGIGYRLMIVPNRQLEEKFTSPVFIFKTRFYFQDVLKDLHLIND